MKAEIEEKEEMISVEIAVMTEEVVAEVAVEEVEVEAEEIKMGNEFWLIDTARTGNKTLNKN